MQKVKETKFSAKNLALMLLLIATLIFLAMASVNLWGKYRAEREFVNKQIALLNHKQDEISELEQKLDRAQKDMQLVLEKQSNVIQTQNQELMQVQDAYFLSRLADDRLQYANDIQAAKQLLSLAQDRIASLSASEYNNAKLVLAANLAKLAALKYPDLKESHDKLAILDGLINAMPVKTAVIQQQKAGRNDPKTKSNLSSMRFDKEWQKTLNLMLEDLKNLVKIRKKTESELDLSYINLEISRARFKLFIEQIRWAIFYKDAVVYQRSIKSAQDLLPQIFDLNNEAVSTFSKTLNELASLQIAAAIPSIKDAVNALQALLIR